MIRFANPTRFLALSSRLIPFLAVASTVLIAAGVYAAFFVAPADYQQGETVRIMYIHVPSAWLSMGCYSLMALSALGTLIWRHPLADVSAKALLPIGMAFTFICLVTGAFWGRPMWGTWWVWDARLTSMLILLFLYIGYIALGDSFEDQERGDKASAMLALVGSVNLPIIHFSVEWWNTLHQPAIRSFEGFSINAAMLWPLLLMVFAFQTYYVSVLIIRLRGELLSAKIRTARFNLAAAE